MINSELDFLFEIQTQHPPCIAELPNNHKNAYEVDLSTRTINSPKFLSVAKDHQAEVIYFVMDRYFDYMDLSTTVCIIQYLTPAPESMPYIYIVPYYDVSSLATENKMIIPWNIDGAATQKKGKVKYSIRFYQLEGEGPAAKLIYNLNTLPAESEVLYGLDVDPLNKEEVDFATDAYELLVKEISALHQKSVQWDILD